MQKNLLTCSALKNDPKCWKHFVVLFGLNLLFATHGFLPNSTVSRLCVSI